MAGDARSGGAVRLVRALGGCSAGLAALALAVLALGAGAAVAAPFPGTIGTVAGGPVLGPVAATSVGQRPAGIAATRAGTPYLYVVDSEHSVVNRVDESTGQQTLFAGAGASGPSADGSVAAGAALSGPSAVAVDAAGDVFIEEAASRVRVVPAVDETLFGRTMAAGHLYTVAGTGTPGFGGDGGPATSAQFDARAFFASPGGIAADAAGDLAIADTFNNVVRFVPAASGSFYGRAMSGGDIYTLAGTPEPEGEGGFGGDGGAASAAKLKGARGVAFDASGNLAIGDTQNQRVRLVSALAATQFGQSMAVGSIYTIAGNGKKEFSGEGGAATAGGLEGAGAVAFDAAGDLELAEAFGERVRLVPRVTAGLFGATRAEGSIYTIAGNGKFGFAGDGGIATGAEFSNVDALAADQSGNVLIADTDNLRVRLEPGKSATLFGAAREEAHIYTVVGNGSQGYSGDGLPATATELAVPEGLALRPQGGLAISDFFNNRIRFVSAGEGVFGQSMSAGDMYTIAGNGSFGFAGDGGLGTSAQLTQPENVAFDAAGDLVIADRGDQRVRFMPAASGTFYGQAMLANHIYTVAGDGIAGSAGDGGAATAAELHEPAAVAVDANGDLYIADAENHRVRFVPASSGTFYGQAMLADHIYTVAGNGKAGFGGDGGPAASAELGDVWSLTLDGAAGDLVIADPDNGRVRFVPAHASTFYGQPMLADHIYTIAGSGSRTYGGDGGPAAAAGLDPNGVAVDAAGDVAIGDEENRRVRLLAAHDEVEFATAMHAGDIYTVAGTGVQGFSGEGGPATAAELSEPAAVIFDPAGDLLFTDGNNNRVRIVYGGAVPPSPPSAPAPKPPPGQAKAPLLTALSQSHARWRAGSKAARISSRRRGRGHRAPLGTTFSFKLDQRAKVKLTFTQRVSGRRQGRRCVAATHKNAHRKRCSRTLVTGTLVLPAHAGSDRVSFQGRLSRTRRLRPGRYTLLVYAFNQNGHSSTRSLTFTVVR